MLWLRSLVVRGAAPALLVAGTLALSAAPACGGSDEPGFGTSGGDGSGAGLPAGTCRNYLDSTCDGLCIAEDDAACHAPVAPVTTCLNDPDCAGLGDARTVCASLEITCPSGGQSICVTGCTGDAECPAGRVCEGHHCVNQPCSCPDNFLCGGEGHCVRTACKVDGDCAKAGSYCVNGLCHESLGTCVPR